MQGNGNCNKHATEDPIRDAHVSPFVFSDCDSLPHPSDRHPAVTSCFKSGVRRKQHEQLFMHLSIPKNNVLCDFRWSVVCERRKPTLFRFPITAWLSRSRPRRGNACGDCEFFFVGAALLDASQFRQRSQLISFSSFKFVVQIFGVDPLAVPVTSQLSATLPTHQSHASRPPRMLD